SHILTICHLANNDDIHIRPETVYDKLTRRSSATPRPYVHRAVKKLIPDILFFLLKPAYQLFVWRRFKHDFIGYSFVVLALKKNRRTINSGSDQTGEVNCRNL